MAVEIKIEHNNTDKVLSELDMSKQMALEIIGMKAEGYAKQNAPVDTGRLRNSLDHELESDSVYIGTNVEYGKYVEFGTMRQRAQPYLEPAVMDHIEEWRNIVLNELKKGE